MKKKYSTLLNKLGKFERVENMRSSNGNDVPNQFIISFQNGRVFQSYESTIVIELHKTINGVSIFIGDNWKYSNTTGKYRNKFLGESGAETQEKIKNEEYGTII